MSKESLGYWTLPKPEINLKRWERIPRVARTTPFGYKVDETDEDFLIPIDNELELLEKAKQHLIQYSYREVANWLSKESGRYISHVGLLIYSCVSDMLVIRFISLSSLSFVVFIFLLKLISKSVNLSNTDSDILFSLLGVLTSNATFLMLSIC